LKVIYIYISLGNAGTPESPHRLALHHGVRSNNQSIMVRSLGNSLDDTHISPGKPPIGASSTSAASSSRPNGGGASHHPGNGHNNRPGTACLSSSGTCCYKSVRLSANPVVSVMYWL